MSNIVRGGQTVFHSLRMLGGVISETLRFNLIIFIMIIVTYNYFAISNSQFVHTIYYAKAIFYQKLTDGKEKIWVGKQKVPARNVYYNQIAKTNYNKTIATMGNSISFATIASLSLYLIWMSYFYIRGKRLKEGKLLRGKNLMAPKEVIKKLKKEKLDSDFKIDALPLVKNKETSHFLVTGTTGAGKSNLFHTLLPQIRQKGQKAIIVDTSGEYISRYYDASCDVILNPFDERGANWSLWADCSTIPQFELFAESLIPENKGGDPFWVRNSRNLFTYTANKLSINSAEDIDEELGNIDTLLDILLRRDLTDVSTFFEGSEVSSLMTVKSEKTTLSLRATLASYLKCLKYTADAKDSFSIREWIANEEASGWLFLTCTPDQRTTLKPLMSSMLDIAVNSLMNLTPNYDRRCWFVVDELASLNKLPSLPTALAEIRKYGGCILTGTQSMHQLKDIYGHSIALTMFTLFNTRIFFRTPEPENALFIANSFGDKEYSEVHENLSYGAHEMRDGISLTETKKTDLPVKPGDLMQLEDLEAFFYLPGGIMTKHKISYKNIEAKEKCFIVKEHKDIKINNPQSEQNSKSIKEEHCPLIEDHAKELEKEYEVV